MKNILFITTTNIAANPRLQKELQLAVQNGFKCTVVQFRLGNWSDILTIELEKSFPKVHFIWLSALRRPVHLWLISSVFEKILRWFPYQLLSGFALSVAVGKRSFLLNSKIKFITGHFDWIIAHNPATFYIAHRFSKKWNCRLGIDVEDYHPGESNNIYEQQRMKLYLQEVLPHASYISYASPLIMKTVQENIAFLNSSQFSIINSFYSSEFPFSAEHKGGPLRLVWFSQFIDRGRGLESLLQIIDSIGDIELHLIGNLNHSFFKEQILGKKNVICHQVMSQQILHKSLHYYDIGLALEPGKDFNNKIALSNKMLAYAQAGLFILASNTPAQDEFLQKSNLDYVQTDLNQNTLFSVLTSLVESRSEIRSRRKFRHLNGKVFDWSNNSDLLLNTWLS